MPFPYPKNIIRKRDCRVLISANNSDVTGFEMICGYNIVELGKMQASAMSQSIQTQIVKIDNSQGIRIPRSLLSC